MISWYFCLICWFNFVAKWDRGRSITNFNPGEGDRIALIGLTANDLTFNSISSSSLEILQKFPSEISTLRVYLEVLAHIDNLNFSFSHPLNDFVGVLPTVEFSGGIENMPNNTPTTPLRGSNSYHF